MPVHRNTPKPPSSLTAYLGKPEESTRRLQALDSIAESLGTNRSKMIQMIADGEIELRVRKRAKAVE